MKKQFFYCAILLFSLAFAGCSRVVVTSADELVMTDRIAETASGIKAILRFDDGTGEMIVTFPDDHAPVCIKGPVAVDKNKFYITVQEYGKTYAFEYKVFGDKVEVFYGGESLDFYPESKEFKTLATDFES